MHDAIRAPGDSAAFDDLFAGGPPLKLQLKLGLVRPGDWRVSSRVLLFVLITWLPLLILAAVEGNLYASDEGRVFLLDFGVLARFVVAGPLLIAAEAACMNVLSRIARSLAELCIVSGIEHPRFMALLAPIRRWRDASLAEAAIAVLAFALSIAVVRGLPLSELPEWHRAGADRSFLSLAGWWHGLVSLPLLLMLIFGWVWRLVLWTRFLLMVSRLELNLVAVHPDKAAGLGFVGYSVRAFCLVGASLGAIVAGNVANQVVHHGATLTQFKYPVGGLVAVVLALSTAPLLVFAPKLLEVWRRGVHEYGELASAFGRQFELEWFADHRSLHKSMLERGDFSAATDLYQVADRLHDLRLVPIDLTSIVLLAGASLLPFVPIVFIALPFDVVLDALVGLLR